MCCASFEYPFLKNKAFVTNLLKLHLISLVWENFGENAR